MLCCYIRIINLLINYYNVTPKPANNFLSFLLRILILKLNSICVNFLKLIISQVSRGICIKRSYCAASFTESGRTGNQLSLDYDPISRLEEEDVELSRFGRVVNFRRRWKLVTQTSAHSAARRNLLRRNLKGFKKYYEDLPEGIALRAWFPGVPSALEKFRAEIWQNRGTLFLPATISLTHALSILSYPDYLSPYIFTSYLPASDSFLCIFFFSSPLSLPLTSLFFFLKVASRDRIRISVRRTTDTYILCIIHYSVDPKRRRNSNKCCFYLILPSFRRPMFANSHIPIVFYFFNFRLFIHFRYLLPLFRLDVVIVLHYS